MAQLNPVDPFDFIIFGGNGDLALRKLLPALWHRHLDGQFSDNSRVIAVGRSPMALEEYLSAVKKGCEVEAGEVEQWDRFESRLCYLSLDTENHDSWQELNETLGARDDVIRAFYLATPPSLFGSIARGIHANGLTVNNMRLVLEKPVGRGIRCSNGFYG